jgi:outer membrane protein OmpA-like peptidoglycan-associated protein
MQGIAKMALRLTKARRVEAARSFCESSAMECALISAMEVTRMFCRSLIVYAVLVVLVTPVWLHAQLDVKDHPLVSRFPGSDVLDYKTAEFDEFSLPLGKIVDENQFTNVQHVEGKVTKFKYSVPKERSSLEIARSYQTALERGGFQILFQCSGEECRAPKSFQGGYRSTSSGVWCFNCEQPMRYFAAKLSRSSGDVYVALDVVKDPYEGGTWLTIVEVKPMAAGLVTVNAAALANDIAQTGHASIYGIYFDTGKAELKPESDATLGEISKLLASNPQLKLHVVGHTDNVGTFAANMALSKQRADAVVAALESRYHVSAARLQAAGVGPLAPVASNKSDDGRAKNRRVELVEQ